jgi:hypothetical protein
MATALKVRLTGRFLGLTHKSWDSFTDRDGKTVGAGSRTVAKLQDVDTCEIFDISVDARTTVPNVAWGTVVAVDTDVYPASNGFRYVMSRMVLAEEAA